MIDFLSDICLFCTHTAPVAADEASWTDRWQTYFSGASLLVSGATLAATVVIALWLRKHEINEKEKDRDLAEEQKAKEDRDAVRKQQLTTTLYLHEKWSSPEFHKIRTDAEIRLAQLPNIEPTYQNLSSYPNKILFIEHFFIDFHSLWKKDLLDTELAQELFSPAFKALAEGYIDILKILENDNWLKDSDDKQKAFQRKYIVPFMALVHSWKA